MKSLLTTTCLLLVLSFAVAQEDTTVPEPDLMLDTAAPVLDTEFCSATLMNCTDENECCSKETYTLNGKFHENYVCAGPIASFVSVSMSEILEIEDYTLECMDKALVEQYKIIKKELMGPI